MPVNNRVVWKYVLEPGRQPASLVAMPGGAKLLHVAAQGDDVCLWALVDPDVAAEPRDLIVVGTGWPMPLEWPAWRPYVGTAQLPNGLVFHVFDEEMPF